MPTALSKDTIQTPDDSQKLYDMIKLCSRSTLSHRPGLLGRL
jgi:hypothetical protein